MKIPIKVKVNKCSACGEEFAKLGDAVDYMNEARKKYRQMFGIITPEEIKGFMKKYGFSLRDMEKLMGIAFKTVDRYLKGAIPDPSNANFLKVIVNEQWTVLSLMNSKNYFAKKKFQRAKEIMEKEIKIKIREINDSIIYTAKKNIIAGSNNMSLSAEKGLWEISMKWNDEIDEKNNFIDKYYSLSNLSSNETKSDENMDFNYEEWENRGVDWEEEFGMAA